MDGVRAKPPVLTRVGVIGDLHCEDEALARVLAYFAEHGAKPVLSVGDLVDGSGDVNRALSLIEQHGVFAVAGNHDRWLLEGQFRNDPEATRLGSLSQKSRLALAALPPMLEFETPRGRLLLCHGLLDNDMAKVTPDDFGYALESNAELQELLRKRRFAFVVNGHTHRTMVRKFGHLTLINAGTLHRRYRQVCTIIDFDQGRVEFYDVASDGIHPSHTEPL